MSHKLIWPLLFQMVEETIQKHFESQDRGLYKYDKNYHDFFCSQAWLHEALAELEKHCKSGWSLSFEVLMLNSFIWLLYWIVVWLIMLLSLTKENLKYLFRFFLTLLYAKYINFCFLFFLISLISCILAGCWSLCEI